jgi:hypothetical protein
MEKVMISITPRGFLHTPNGEHYYLLDNHPLDWDNWTGDRQAWQVIKAEMEFTDEDAVYWRPVSGRMTAIVSNQSTVEFCTIEPFEISEYDWVAESNAAWDSMTPEEIEDYEKQQLRFDEIFA